MFHGVISRLNTDSIKWNGMKGIYGADDLLPMWVADMDFASPAQVKEAIIKRAEHGLFGYVIPPAQMKDTVQNWVSKRYKWDISTDWLLPSSGVIVSIAHAIQSFTSEGDKVMVQSPVYMPFFTMIENNKRTVINNELQLKDGKYEIDFADFEEKLKSGVKLFILCNPHNPVGRVWKQEELIKMGELCHRYGVIIVSDEIHGDLIHKPNIHTPIASLRKEFAEITITCIAPSKTFNIPGLQASIMIIPNGELRKEIQTTQGKAGFHGLNLFGNIALDTAYSQGEDWLEALLDYLQGNIRFAKEFIEKEIPSIPFIEPEGTYLLWLDCRAFGLSNDELMKRLVEKGKIALEPGKKYGEGGDGFVRMNIGCPRSTLEDGLKRLKTALI